MRPNPPLCPPGPRPVRVDAHLRPGGAAQGFTTQPGAAAFIRDRQTPATDTELAVLKLAPADHASSRDNHATIATAMSANAGRLCIGDQDGLREWIFVSTGERQLGWLA